MLKRTTALTTWLSESIGSTVKISGIVRRSLSERVDRMTSDFAIGIASSIDASKDLMTSESAPSTGFGY